MLEIFEKIPKLASQKHFVLILSCLSLFLSVVYNWLWNTLSEELVKCKGYFKIKLGKNYKYI